MNVVLYLSGQNIESAQRLRHVAAATVPPYCLETIYSYDRLGIRLNKVPQEIAVVILLAIDRVQLAKLITLRPLLENVRNIVVLPDRNAGTLSMGHRLRPRLLADIGDDFSEVAAVLSKIMASQQLPFCNGINF